MNYLILFALWLPVVGSSLELNHDYRGRECGEAIPGKKVCLKETKERSERKAAIKGPFESEKSWEQRVESICGSYDGKIVKRNESYSVVDGDPGPRFAHSINGNPRDPSNPIIPIGGSFGQQQVIYNVTCEYYKVSDYICDDYDNKTYPQCSVYFDDVALRNHLTVVSASVDSDILSLLEAETSYIKTYNSERIFWCYIDSYKDQEMYDFSIADAMDDARDSYEKMFFRKHSDVSFQCDADADVVIPSDFEVEDGVQCSSVNYFDIVQIIIDIDDEIREFQNLGKDISKLEFKKTNYNRCAKVLISNSKRSSMSDTQSDLNLIKENIKDKYYSDEARNSLDSVIEKLDVVKDI